MTEFSTLDADTLSEHRHLRSKLDDARTERDAALKLLERADRAVQVATDDLIAFIDELAGVGVRQQLYKVWVWDSRFEARPSKCYEVRAGSEREARRRAISAASVKLGPSPYWRAEVAL